MDFKKKLSLLSTLALAISTNTMAFQTWTGTKTLAQFEYDKVTPITIEMNAKHGTISIADGLTAGHGTFQIVHDQIEVKLKKPVEYSGFPMLFNPNTNQTEQVFTKTTLDTYSFKELGQSAYEIIAKGQVCYNYRRQDGSNQEECKGYETDFDAGSFIAITDRAIKTTFEVGDKIAIQSYTGVEYLEILQNGQVNSLANSTDSAKLTNLVLKDAKIEARFDNNQTVSYSRLAQRNGDELLIGVVRGEDDLLVGITVGTIVVDENVNSIGIDFSGQYNLVGFGAQSSVGDEFIIEFRKSGFAGFTNYEASTDSESSVLWSWEQTLTGMKATRWMLLEGDQFYGEFAQTEEQVQFCLDNNEKCHPYQQREYRIIAKDGNKFSMLRRMEHSQPGETGNTPRVHFTLNYFYKK